MVIVVLLFGILSMIGVFMLAVLFAATLALPMAWVLMVLLGAFSHASGFHSFALGFWACFFGLTIFNMIFGTISFNKKGR